MMDLRNQSEDGSLSKEVVVMNYVNLIGRKKTESKILKGKVSKALLIRPRLTLSLALRE